MLANLCEAMRRRQILVPEGPAAGVNLICVVGRPNAQMQIQERLELWLGRSWAAHLDAAEYL